MINSPYGTVSFVTKYERTILMNYKLVLKIVAAILEIIAIVLSLLL